MFQNFALTFLNLLKSPTFEFAILDSTVQECKVV